MDTATENRATIDELAFTRHTTRSTTTLNDSIKYRDGNDTYDFPLPNFTFGCLSERPLDQRSHPKQEFPKGSDSDQECEKKLEGTKDNTLDTKLLVTAKETLKTTPYNHHNTLQRSFSALDAEVAPIRPRLEDPRRFRSVHSFFRRTLSKSHGAELPTLPMRPHTRAREPDRSPAEMTQPQQSPVRFYSRPSTAHASKTKMSIDAPPPCRSLSSARSKTTSPLKRLEHWLESSLLTHIHPRRDAVSSPIENADRPSPAMSLDSSDTTSTDHGRMGLFNFGFVSVQNGREEITTSPTASSEMQSSGVSDKSWSSSRSLRNVAVSRDDKPLPLFACESCQKRTDIASLSSSSCTSQTPITNEFSSFYFSDAGSGLHRSMLSSSVDGSGHRSSPYAESNGCHTHSIESAINSPWSNIEPVTPRSSIDLDHGPDHAGHKASTDIHVATARQISLEQARWVVNSADVHTISKPSEWSKKPTIVDLDRPRRRRRAYHTPGGGQ